MGRLEHVRLQRLCSALNMPIYKGEIFTARDFWTFDPERGAIDVRQADGHPDNVYAEANLLASTGWDVSTSRNGPYVALTATRHRPDPTYPTIERWSVETEAIEKPIWTLPAVQTEGAAFTGAMCKYRDEIEAALREGTELPAGLVSLPNAPKVIIEMLRGVQGYEHETTKLSRTRVFNFQSPPPAGPQVFDNQKRLVYTKAQLSALEGIPVGVNFTLPDDTQDAPTNAKYVTAANQTGLESFWGYRLREQEATITGATTGEHVSTWLYAQWSMFSYQPAP